MREILLSKWTLIQSAQKLLVKPVQTYHLNQSAPNGPNSQVIFELIESGHLQTFKCLVIYAIAKYQLHRQE